MVELETIETTGCICYHFLKKNNRSKQHQPLNALDEIRSLWFVHQKTSFIENLYKRNSLLVEVMKLKRGN